MICSYRECPLLKKLSPLPWPQFSIVLFLLLADPLTSQIISPFAPQLIRDIGITNGNENQVGYYVGIMQSCFFLTQAMTVLHWSRLSDSIGRKPVILSGLVGLAISMYCFGLSKSFLGLVISGSLSGALNGNLGVFKSMMADMTDSTNMSKAYAYLPIVWSIGSTLGPIIGGVLARPAERFPDVFGHNEFMKKYPYFLPCSVAATFSFIAWIVAIFLLKETATNPQNLVVAAANYVILSLVDIAFQAVHPLFLSTPINLGGFGLPPPTIGKILSLIAVLDGIFQIFFFAKIYGRWGPKRVFITGLLSAIPAFMLFPIINLLARHQGYSLAAWIAIVAQATVFVAVNCSFGAIYIFIAAASPNRASLGATNGLSETTVSFMRAVGYLGGYLVYLILLFFTFISLCIGWLLPQHIQSRL
ncbi:major facilitator superfamily domain-containing protein [Crepidotus variabilis]|uniref:Major facilitator superfamily domain-containing protein n=1 Tax=Crepidotus variabilis TaxID=179855 RepID=A0A9P6E6T6_9AGAR|nr:major facilitator superfamily domain-containing protein [Crepidotus variabilis]